MSENTEIRKQGWLARNGLKAGGGVGMMVLAFLSNEIWSDVKAMNEKVAKLEQRQEEQDRIWQTIFSIQQKSDDAMTEASIARALAEASLNGEGVDARALLESLGVLLEEPEVEFTEERIQEFRNVQQRAYGPAGKK